MRITLDIPDRLYRRLSARAEASAAPMDETIIATLSASLAADDPVARATRASEGQRLRAAMRDVLADTSGWRTSFASDMSREERERMLRALPPLDPPTSQLIIDEREDRL